ncbi:zinc-dependent metalloprotease [Hyphococcus sp. DH-69]|uniref:zinc-dependent metalloprotease n=1 Tax=Hyphococcus formosus TaxID=3143534 RepID=UPI00398B03C4
MRRFLVLLSATLLLAACGKNTADSGATPAPETEAAAPAAPEKSGDWTPDAAKNMTRQDGFLTLFTDPDAGRVLAQFPTADDDGVSLRAIYASGLTSGLGSNPIGLDRGLFESGVIVAFRKVGAKLVVEQENWTYRASSENPLERKAVRESFARSFLWAGNVIETGPNGEMLVDISGFLTRDGLGVQAALKAHPKGGHYTIAADRTFPDTENVFAFPDNAEFDSYMTLVSDEPGREVRSTAADARSVTLIVHHSLVRLPDDGYEPRIFDPRSGVIDVPYYDFSAPLDAPIIQTYARRYRLEKEDPSEETSPAINPIVFYVDPGAPPQIRNALIEGASWWNEAFEAAGFEDAFRVEPLPEGAHPRDARYNVISWTHRQTRGWSYGGGISDPRTGEMIKGSVILGSQRVRQDRMIFEGLVGAANSGTGGENDPVNIALKRIRQLSAHEVGHSLGFAHNFAASTNDRASVMDYPAPLVTVGDDGSLDLSSAYDQGIGAWDKAAATWLYAQFPDEADEPEELSKIIDETYSSGLRFVGDSEGRSVATANPYGSVWDNGEDAVKALRDTMAVRRIALDQFGPHVIKSGRSMAELRAVIVPIYLYHRYQIAAAAKLVGGYDFTYKSNGDDLEAAKPVSDEVQRAALAALSETLDPSALTLSDDVVNMISPPLGGFGSADRTEAFAGNTGPVFDLLAAADSAATLSLGALLHPDRAARLVDYKSRNQENLGLLEVLQEIERTIFASQNTARKQAIAHRVQTRYISTLINMSGGSAAAGEIQAAAVGLSSGGGQVATPDVQAIIDLYLKGLRTRIAPGLLEGQTVERAHREWLIANIDRHFERPAPARLPVVNAPETPPGSPIGETCWHCD